MREIIFVGTDDQVRERIDAVRDAMRPLFEELRLSYHVITANDPFFNGHVSRSGRLTSCIDSSSRIGHNCPTVRYRGCRFV